MHPVLRRVIMLFLLFIALSSKAQQYVIIKGQVWDLSGNELVGAHAYNNTRHYGTFTDIDGIFFMVVVPGDSLRVSMIGFKPYKMRIPTRLNANSYKLDLTLLADTILLKVAEIKPYPATYAELKREFIKLKVPEEKILPKIIMPSDPTLNQYANPGGGILLPGPIGLLYNAFSKEAKELKKMNVILAQNSLRDQLLSIVSRNTLEKKFGLKTDDEIDEMMKSCGITSEYLNQTREYIVIQKLMRCAGNKGIKP